LCWGAAIREASGMGDRAGARIRGTGMEPFIRHKQKGAPETYRIRTWEEQFPGLTAGFTGRQGGAGTAPYESLNLGLHVGDKPETVIENRRRLAEEIGVPLSSWTFGEQVHGCEVQVVDSTHRGKGTVSREDAFQERDAFITSATGNVLAGLFADCVPLLFVDPGRRAVGLAHAGWKGSVLQIARLTVERMSQEFGSRPEAIHGAIGPSIGACCYEVDTRITSRLEEETGLSGEPYFTKSIHSGKFMLNLQEINQKIMIEAGILPQHIEITKLCTGCNLSQFFSHRLENGLTGRMAAWIGWKDTALR
jgi:polyphenol oxidase